MELLTLIGAIVVLWYAVPYAVWMAVCVLGLVACAIGERLAK